MATLYVVAAFVVAAAVRAAIGSEDPSGAVSVLIGLFTIGTVAVIIWLMWSYIRDVVAHREMPTVLRAGWVFALLCLWPIAFPAYWATNVRVRD